VTELVDSDVAGQRNEFHREGALRWPTPIYPES
jgi:hypothetical protein